MINGGGRPYGFEPDQVTLRPAEVAILVEAKDRYLAGETMRDIVRDFYQRGTKAGRPASCYPLLSSANDSRSTVEA